MAKEIFRLLVMPAVPNIQEVINRFPFPVSLTRGQFKNLEFIFKNGQVRILHQGTDLADFSFVWLCSCWNTRDLAYAVQLYLKQNNIPNTQVEKGTSKLTDQMIFSLNQIPTPHTLFIGRKDIKRNLARIKKVCGYPLIVKDIKGSRGTSSVKINSEQELLAKVKKLPRHKKYIFQKYIANEYDWGIMVANRVVVSGEKSYPDKGEFRNNACNGAREIFVDPADIPDHIKQLAIDTSDALGLAWSRSDIIIDKETQEPYVLETNRFPGITSKTSEVDGSYAFLSSQITSLARPA